MSARPARARLQSLCGTSRGLAHDKSASEQKDAKRRPCRHGAVWACQANADVSRRMARVFK